MGGRRRARSGVRGLIDSPRALAMIAVCGLCVMVALMIMIAVGGHSSHRSRPEALTVPATSPEAAPTPAPVGTGALRSFLRRTDRVDAGHVTAIRWTGSYLRVYTDLPESAANSPAALTLCENAARYLQEQDRAPVVFIQAGDYAVLANKMSVSDGCRLKPVP